jgi:hypothetical protein
MTPSQSPMLYWSPRYVLQRPKMAPMVWRIPGAVADDTSDVNSGQQRLRLRQPDRARGRKG